MKKLLTLVLALVMVLAIAAPAMAFTKEGETAMADYDITLELQEWDDNEDFFRGNAIVVDDPAADRGYVKNEIVCVKAGITVEKYATPEGDLALYLDGENVAFYFNLYESVFAPLANKAAAAAGFTAFHGVVEPTMDGGEVVGWEITEQEVFEGVSKDKTYQWLFWVRVLDDDASLTWTLELNGKAGKDLEVASWTDVGDGKVYLSTDDKKAAGFYAIELDGFKDYQLVIFFKAGFKTTDMLIVDADTAAPITYLVDEDGKLHVSDDATTMIGADYNAFLPPYKFSAEFASTTDKAAARFLEAVMEEYNLDPANAGNILRPTYFSAGASADDSKEVTVEIKPWEAYLSVPDVVVVDPPKTGDASTMIGFVMIIAALAGVVVFKKVRA